MFDNTYGHIDCRLNELNQNVFKDLSVLTHHTILEIRHKANDLSKMHLIH